MSIYTIFYRENGGPEEHRRVSFEELEEIEVLRPPSLQLICVVVEPDPANDPGEKYGYQKGESLFTDPDPVDHWRSGHPFWRQNPYDSWR